MNGVYSLTDYHRAVLGALENIPWAETVGIYPEIPDGFPTPAIFFDVASWERSEREIGGNVTLNLTCNIYILRHFIAGEGEDNEVQGSTDVRVRNAALKMSDWIHGRQFGPGMTPAVMASAEPVTWESGDDEHNYASWSVSFNQLVAVGTDPFEVAGSLTAKEFWFGVWPEIGPKHKDDYVLVNGAKGGG